MFENKQLPTIICLLGPTCAGKTRLAIELTQALPCDIVSVDSGLIYRGMDIGTAKPSPAELALAPHRLINILDPSESYSAGQFLKDALSEIKTILNEGRIPLLVGGTVLYFKALQQGLAELPSANAEIRQQINQRAEGIGWQALHCELTRIDPLAAARIHPNDAQRIQRALEVYELTGMPLSHFFTAEAEHAKAFNFLNIGLLPRSRAYLNQLIAERFVAMLKAGLMDEVKSLWERGDLNEDFPSIRCVGYRQVWHYLQHKISESELVEKGINATRQLAKRQLTGLRPWPNLTWFDSLRADTLQAIIKLILTGP